MKRTVKEIFKSNLKGKNFMTPDIIKYGESGAYIYELSEGRFMNSKMYGVTVLTRRGERTELDNSFFDLEEAKAYIETLKMVKQ